VWWSTVTRPWRKKRSNMGPYLTSSPAARARRCCYTFDGRRRCSSLARTVTKLDAVALGSEPSGGQERGRAESERQKWRRRRKGKGREPSSAPDKARPAWATTATGGDRRLRALHRERSHRAVTGSMVSGVGPGTGPGGEIRLGPLTSGPDPVTIFSFKFSI
jgi:hypothetical protein